MSEIITRLEDKYIVIINALEHYYKTYRNEFMMPITIELIEDFSIKLKELEKKDDVRNSEIAPNRI